MRNIQKLAAFLILVGTSATSEARWYDAKVGRWLSEDPIRDENAANPYQYALNNPVKHIDPTGLKVDLSLAGGLTGPLGNLLAKAPLAADFYSRIDLDQNTTWFLVDTRAIPLGKVFPPGMGTGISGIMGNLPVGDTGRFRSGYIVLNSIEIPNWRFRTKYGFCDHFTLERALGHELSHAALGVGEGAAVTFENAISLELYGPLAPIRIGHDAKRD